MRPKRRGIGLAASVAIAIVAALAVGIVAVTLFPNGIITTTVTQATSTTTSSSAGVNSTMSESSTTTCLPGSISNPVSNGTAAYTTDCPLGLTLGVETNPVLAAGENGTIYLSIASDNATSRNVTYTGFPSFPHGPDVTSPTAYDYVQPLQPTCGTPTPGYAPAFFVVYNSSGAPLQLSDAPYGVVSCITSVQAYYHFDGYETIKATVILGGYWTSTDASEPWINATYSQFAPGSYTIVAFDPWQQVIELNFTVVASTSTTTSSTSGAGAPPSTSAVALANTTLSGFPGAIALDSNNSRIYVADMFANKLSVLDAANDKLVGTITLPGTSWSSMAIDPQRNIIFVPVQGCTNLENVSNSCDSSNATSLKGGIVEIAGSNDSIIKELPLQLGGLVVDPGTGILYGAEGGSVPSSNESGYLLAVSERSGTVLANLSLNAFPLSVAMDTNTNTLYVGACQQLILACGGAEVLIVNGTTDQVQGKVALPFDAVNFPVVVDQDTDVVYVMGLGSNLTLLAINGATGAVEYSANLGGSCQGAGGGELALNAQGNELLVSFDSQDLFLAINAGNGQITSMLSTPQGVQGLVYNPNTNQTYITAELQNANAGYLLVLPGSRGGGYVNYTLLSNHLCLP